MSRIASIIGLKGGKWQNLSAGPASNIREEYKANAYAGFERILYMDSSGATKRKKGKAISKVATPKKGKKAGA